MVKRLRFSVIMISVLAAAPNSTAGIQETEPCTVLLDPAHDTYDLSTYEGGPPLWDDVGIDIRSVTLSSNETDFIVAITLEQASPSDRSALFERDQIVSWRMPDGALHEVLAGDGLSGQTFQFYDGQDVHEVTGSIAANRTAVEVRVPLELVPRIAHGRMMRSFAAFTATGPSAPGTYFLPQTLPLARYDRAPNSAADFDQSRHALDGECSTAGGEL